MDRINLREVGADLESAALPPGVDGNVASLPVVRDGKLSVNQRPGRLRVQKAVHPVQEIQGASNSKLENKVVALNNLYGTHMSQRMQMEQFYLSRPLRLPGLRSEFSGLRTLLDEDEDLDFEDTLNDPFLRETPVNIHAEMEKRVFGHAL